MKFAFLISAHTDPCQLKRLISRLPRRAVFVVHVDAKSDLQAFTSIIRDDRVFFVSQRTNVMWGSIGVVEAQMSMIRQALLLHQREPVNYFLALSGLDYPLWSNSRMTSFFSDCGDEEFIVTLSMEHQGEFAQLYREHRPFNYRYWPYGSLGSKFRVALRKIIYGMGIRKDIHFKAKGKDYVIHKGSMNWAITPALAAYALDFWDNNPEYRHYFHDSFAPDETFIQTLTAYSPFASKAIRKEGLFKSQQDITPLHYIDYTDGTKIFTEADFQLLIDSDKMFCRKAVTGKSDKLMDLIDKHREAIDNTAQPAL